MVVVTIIIVILIIVYFFYYSMDSKTYLPNKHTLYINEDLNTEAHGLVYDVTIKEDLYHKAKKLKVLYLNPTKNAIRLYHSFVSLNG